MVKWAHEEEIYSRMSSVVIWLPSHVGRRVILPLSFVIFAFAKHGGCGAVSSRSGTLDGTLFDSAWHTGWHTL